MATRSSEPIEDQRPRPVADAITEEFWAWVQREELRLQWCDRCARLIFPPSPFCAGCRTEPAEWRSVSGRGTIYSSGVVRRAFVPGFTPPYAVVSVQLEEQDDLRLISNFPMDADAPPRIGRPVRLTFERRDWGLLPQFVPSDAEED